MTITKKVTDNNITLEITDGDEHVFVTVFREGDMLVVQGKFPGIPTVWQEEIPVNNGS